MFEEASGISKYKQQRKETLRQLERTALDLARVEDNLKFVQQNVNMFERQAKKAEKWREIKKAYVSLELSYNHDSLRGTGRQVPRVRGRVRKEQGKGLVRCSPRSRYARPNWKRASCSSWKKSRS